MSSKKTLEINPTNAIMEELRKRSEVGRKTGHCLAVEVDNRPRSCCG